MATRYPAPAAPDRPASLRPRSRRLSRRRQPGRLRPRRLEPGSTPPFVNQVAHTDAAEREVAAGGPQVGDLLPGPHGIMAGR